MKVPGVFYSLLAAVGVWAVDYFTTGAGSGIPWAPILVAAIPILLKAITVNVPPEQTPATARGADEGKSKTTKFLLG
jgi:hypothetical protein